VRQVADKWAVVFGSEYVNVELDQKARGRGGGALRDREVPKQEGEAELGLGAEAGSWSVFDGWPDSPAAPMGCCAHV